MDEINNFKIIHVFINIFVRFIRKMKKKIRIIFESINIYILHKIIIYLI